MLTVRRIVRRSLPLVVAVLTGIGCALMPISCPPHRVCEAPGPVPHLYGYDFRDLEEAGFAAETVQRIGHNSSGTLLFLEVRGRTRPSWIVSADGRREVAKPGRYSRVDEAGEFVGWVDDRGDLQLRSGVTVRGVIYPSFDPSGRYFSVGGDIRRTEDPERTIAKLAFGGAHLFLHREGLVVCGRPSFTPSVDIVCARLVGQDELRVEKRWLVRQPERWWGFGSWEVVDLDPWSDNLLMFQGWDWGKARWYLYDLRNETMRYIGPAREHGFFLAADIIGQSKRASTR